MMRTVMAAGLLLVLLASGRAWAQTNTCTLSITSPLNFGTYTGAQVRSTTPFIVTCRSGTDGWYIPMNAGTGAGATVNQRYLTGPNGAELAYEIYRDSAYSAIWGNTYPTNTEDGTGGYNGTVYAQLNGGQTVPAGTYTDTVSTDTTSFTLTVLITGSCTISANALAFGNYTGAVLNGTTSMAVTCTNNIPYTVGLNAGTATGATVTNRMMTGPNGSLLKYSLFSNSGRTTNWGNSSGSWVSGTGTGSAQTLTVYGQIPASQNTMSGTYMDTIIATVTY